PDDPGDGNLDADCRIQRDERRQGGRPAVRDRPGRDHLRWHAGRGVQARRRHADDPRITRCGAGSRQDGPMSSLVRGLRGMPGVIWRAIRARPGIFLGVALAVVVLDLCLPLFVLSVFRKPWDHFSFNPWLRNLPGWLLSPTQTLARKVEFVSDVSLFWFIASSSYDAAEWGFSVGLQDLLRWLYMGGVFGAYFAVWLYGRARLARRPWQGGGRGGAAGAVLSTLGLATAPCSVAGCGLPVLPVMGLALQGLTSGTLAALATVSRLATQAVLAGMTLAVVALACLIAISTEQQERRGEGLTKA